MVYILAEQGDHGACGERLRRNIMAVDKVEYDVAGKKLELISDQSTKFIGLATAPYQAGIALFLVMGLGSIPMTFEKNCAIWFNSVYVSGDVPPPEDIETCYEVGSWAWSWMEPTSGVACFVILAAQMIRAQMLNMHIRPYRDWVQQRRAQRLVSKFPTYNEEFVEAFAMTATLTPKRLGIIQVEDDDVKRHIHRDAPNVKLGA